MNGTIAAILSIQLRISLSLRWNDGWKTQISSCRSFFGFNQCSSVSRFRHRNKKKTGAFCLDRSFRSFLRIQKGCPTMAQADPPSLETAKSIRPTNFRIIPRIPNPTSHFIRGYNSLKFLEGAMRPTSAKPTIFIQSISRGFSRGSRDTPRNNKSPNGRDSGTRERPAGGYPPSVAPA